MKPPDGAVSVLLSTLQEAVAEPIKVKVIQYTE
jgi:hypothetical protein